MAAPSDNSPGTNLSGLLPHTGEGIVIDIGTGDGRFVSAQAKANPNKFYIGIDANTKPLEKPSMKATRKSSKGGLPNALFVQASVEDLPEELNGVADEIHIHFPWGSLLRAVAIADESVLKALRRVAARECLVEIIIGLDPDRDRQEMERLGLSEFSSDYIFSKLIPRYEGAGFKAIGHGSLSPDEWGKVESSWAKRLQGNQHREVFFLILTAI